MFHPQAEQEIGGLAHRGSWTQPQDPHDLVAIEIGPDLGELLFLASLAMRCSSASYALASRDALALFLVVQSARVSTCSRESSGPASRTYLRTAESVHSPVPYP
jgi:hypothetical protein